MYRAVGAADLEREARALDLLRARFPEWQARGYVPSRAIAPGDETSRLLRERGWTHWHHLFTPRQLLVHGKLAEVSATSGFSDEATAACLLGVGRAADWNSKLSRWWTDRDHEKVIQTFSNQALNTLVTFGSRGVRTLADSWFLRQNDAPPLPNGRGSVRPGDMRTAGATPVPPAGAATPRAAARSGDPARGATHAPPAGVAASGQRPGGEDRQMDRPTPTPPAGAAARAVVRPGDARTVGATHAPPAGATARAVVRPGDARTVGVTADVWITDPPYADAINYHELSEFFLAWYEKPLARLFPGAGVDSRRALAVRGAGADFRAGMVASYRNLAARMPDDGLQVVLFTHQDASIWADLTLILWAAGLRVTAAWTIGTETPFGEKEGNYVQGTVLMVLRKQTSAETAFLDEVVPEVETEVERQLDAMLWLDDREAPNFSDADYQLAAYAAALRVLTRYRAVEDVDVARQLARGRRADEDDPIERIIADAVRTASDFLVPRGLPAHLWRRLGPEEKLYLKGLDVESHDEFRAGVYQEFARGFGVRDYRALLRTGRANETRLKTASELGRRELADSAFGRSLVRHALYAVWWTAEQGGDPADSLRWLRAELSDDYWPRREGLAAVLRYLAALDAAHWREDAAAARVLAGAVENDHV